ncbi:hypothetical protein LHYA1_G005978 [Lachnellula hyalina]|uniref:Uncharacterized protein n=1 Tax=Lachnellula hyalina TaxID=1316788 RepID=A0A8H8R0E9_9HELO|nr:uncharacterized protein LHYA1_G005978 [Lachnellula hyalina]TVY25125.1 hypothetical protein LHYA1_G005978 [Lachnellula hyalina]
MRALVGGVYNTRRNTSTLNQDSNQNQQSKSKSNTTNSTPTPTPTRPRLAKPSHCLPLQTRDKNAMMRVQKGVTPMPLKSGNANMAPYDKQNASRPLMPTLSATARPSARQPLTPRVAGAASPALSTPLSRRPQRLESNTTPTREEISTPVSTFLNSNITPRSGSRKNRVDSANTTPTGTPNGTPAPPLTNESTRFHDIPVYGSGLGIAGMDNDGPKRHTVSFNTPSDIGARSPASNSGDSKFFFASDAKPTPPPQRPPIQSKTSSFFYASGENIPQQTQSSSASAVGSTVGEERAPAKFFHANGTPDLQLSPSPHFPPPRPSSVVSNSTRMTSPRLSTASPGTLSPPQRPLSPTKLNQQASVPSLRNTPSLPSPGIPRPQQVGRGQSANNIVLPRRQSNEAGQRVISHGRSTSTGSTGPTLRKVSGGSSMSSIEPTTPLHMVTKSVPISTPEEQPEEKFNDNAPELQSPIKTGQTLDQLNELAANARRERKVLDLEITNSSLEAINRTLEREMRKQTAELRRYRRLSRSGRLSIATSASMRTSTTLSMDGIEGDALSDMSEKEEEQDEDEDDFEIEESSDSESSLSPAAMAESDLRHRKKDEKRLQLDLSKHQQLLIDSQKMNQSLKRCLGWTEDLISEGRKALEYSVKISDVELGGRVLAPEEVGDNEGMSDIGASLLREARERMGANAWGGEGKDDRDSGIEIDGSLKEHVPPPLPAPPPPSLPPS